MFKFLVPEKIYPCARVAPMGRRPLFLENEPESRAPKPVIRAVFRKDISSIEEKADVLGETNFQARAQVAFVSS
jgi:hypothetical protein